MGLELRHPILKWGGVGWEWKKQLCEKKNQEFLSEHLNKTPLRDQPRHSVSLIWRVHDTWNRYTAFPTFSYGSFPLPPLPPTSSPWGCLNNHRQGKVQNRNALFLYHTPLQVWCKQNSTARKFIHLPSSVKWFAWLRPFLTHLTHLSGSLSQSMLHRNLSQAIQPTV